MGAVEYAENTLGVHEILAGALKAREDLDKVYTELSEQRDAKRLAEQNLADREMELAIEERGRHPEMSQAQMDKHIKAVYFKDETWRRLRDELREMTDALDGMEFDRRIKERDIEIGCARMNELGGYLAYLAAVKNASTAKTTT
jgi:hypothetical protein